MAASRTPRVQRCGLGGGTTFLDSQGRWALAQMNPTTGVGGAHLLLRPPMARHPVVLCGPLFLGRFFCRPPSVLSAAFLSSLTRAPWRPAKAQPPPQPAQPAAWHSHDSAPKIGGLTEKSHHEPTSIPASRILPSFQACRPTRSAARSAASACACSSSPPPAEASRSSTFSNPDDPP